MSIPKEQVAQLKAFIELLRLNPAILHTPELQFFKDYIESLGGKISEERSSPSHDMPKAQPKRAEPTKPAPAEPQADDDELVESDIEFDNEGVIGESL